MQGNAALEVVVFGLRDFRLGRIATAAVLAQAAFLYLAAVRCWCSHLLPQPSQYLVPAEVCCSFYA